MSRFSYRPQVVILFLAWLLVLAGVYWQVNFAKSYKTLRIGDENYKLEVADEVEEYRRGLSNRHQLSADEGMVFIYKIPGKYCFWMKDTLIPLDMIWLNDHKEIIHLERGVQPDTYPHSFCPARAASYVIELYAGEAARHKLHIGQALAF